MIFLNKKGFTLIGLIVVVVIVGVVSAVIVPPVVRLIRSKPIKTEFMTDAKQKTVEVVAGGILDMVKKEKEKAYYDGQRDALEGDVRIKKISASQYIWIKSPWDDGTEPKFHPPVKDSSGLKKPKGEYW
jgi:prepilin-type N-terminal cleavage/methylation domain-containing protein